MHAAGLQGQAFVDQLLSLEGEGYGAISVFIGHMDFFNGLIGYPLGSPERLEQARVIARMIGIQGPDVQG